jgi:hypothetical protein
VTVGHSLIRSCNSWQWILLLRRLGRHLFLLEIISEGVGRKIGRMKRHDDGSFFLDGRRMIDTPYRQVTLA